MNTESVLPILCEWLVKSALISSGAWLLLQGWRGATAAHRHLVWLLALAAIMMLPCTRLAAPRWAISLQPPQRTTITLPATTLPAAEPFDTMLLAEIPPAPARIRTPLDWRKIILSIWLSGAALVLGYRLFGSWRLHRLYRRSAPADDPRVRLLLARTAGELSLLRRVEIRVSDECRVPVTWGTWRPVMLLPRHALTWSDTWLIAAIRHEGAHILRGDDLTRWTAWIACALYWPNPFIWLAARSLRVAQEQAADDLVLSFGTPAEEYATQLVEAARLVAARGIFVGHAVAMACPSTLEDRIVAIVDGHRDRRPLGRFAAAVGSIVVMLTLALCTAAQLQGAAEKPAGAEGTKAASVFGPQIEISAKFVELPTKSAPDAQIQLPSEGAPDTSVPSDKLTIFSDPQFQLIFRALNQRKGVNILSAPRVITRSNQRAIIETIREFRYPTEWEKDGGKWTPSQFETKNIGTTVEVEPRLKENGALELHTIASVVEFLGYVDLDDDKALPAPKDALSGGEARMPQVPPGHRYKSVFSERKREETVELKSEETAMIPDLPQTADIKPFEQNAPHGGLVVFLSPRLLEVAPQRQLAPAASTTAEETKEEAARIVIPKFELHEATLQEAIASLRQKIAEVSGDKAALTILSNPSADADSVRITISLTQVPLSEAAKYVAELANQKLDFRPGAIVIGTQAPGAAAARIGGAPAPPAESAVHEKALHIVLPRFEIREATVAEAIDALTKQSAAFDPEKTGIKILLVPSKDPKSLPFPPEDARITLQLTNIPLVEALRYVAGLANLEVIYKPTAVELRPVRPPAPGVPGGPAGALPPIPAAAAGLILKEWKMPPDLVPKGQSGQDWLTSQGIVFRAGAAATYTPDLGPTLPSRLIVRNTREQIDLIDALIWRSISGTPAAAAVANPASDGTDKVQITANNTGFENGVATAEGDVHFVLGTYDVWAQKLRYNPTTRQAEVTGHATIKSGNNFIDGDDMTLALKPNGGIDVSGPHTTHIITTAVPPGGVRPADDDVGDLFVRAYMTIQKSEQLEHDGKIPEALQLLQNAAAQLDELAKKYPAWQPQVVAYRKMRTAKAIERLQGAPSR